jgi:hypothetical protein
MVGQPDSKTFQGSERSRVGCCDSELLCCVFSAGGQQADFQSLVCVAQECILDGGLARIIS